MLSQSQQNISEFAVVSYAINDRVLIKLDKLEHFRLGHVAAQEHKQPAYTCRVQLVTVQAGPHPGTVCCVIYKINNIL